MMHDGTPAAHHANTPDGRDGRAAFVDDGGLLRFAGRWIAVTDQQAPMVELLARRLGSLVRNEELLAAHCAGGGANNRGALRARICRLRRQLATVGLTLHVVRGRGVLVEPVSSDRNG